MWSTELIATRLWNVTVSQVL